MIQPSPDNVSSLHSQISGLLNYVQTKEGMSMDTQMHEGLKQFLREVSVLDHVLPSHLKDGVIEQINLERLKNNEPKNQQQEILYTNIMKFLDSYQN